MDGLITDAMVLAELTRLAGVEPDAARVRERDDRGFVEFYWQRDEYGVGFSVYDRDRALSLDTFSRRICEPVISAWRNGAAH